ncbi:hypothetical protein [Tenacibaculum agarivorans]|uniref:hypothetical protein n=1 Tax=Tenacibaculum agarivorans TaxID=1908389 RepID=UPI00094B9272|nr:hypothetical protein [Tenacibaculum agarivorans]
MDNIDVFLTSAQESIPDGVIIMQQFFLVFSRFEYALKKTDDFLIERHGAASANWDAYADSINEDFCNLINQELDGFGFNHEKIVKLKEAVDFFVMEPPRKQEVEGGVLVYRDRVREDDSLTRKICVYIRRVRNNVMHGGKYIGSNAIGSRNYKLLDLSLYLMDCFLELNDEVKHNFHEYID